MAVVPSALGLSLHHLTITRSMLGFKLKLGLAWRQAVSDLFTACDNNKVTVRFQNNNFNLGLARPQAVCRLFFTSRDCQGIGGGLGFKIIS